MRTSPTVAVARVELRRFVNQRENIFFSFVMPLLLVFVIGLQFGAGAVETRVLLVGESSQLREDLAGELTAAEVSVVDHRSALAQLARGRADLAVIVDDAAAAAYEESSPAPVELEIVRGSGANVLLADQEVGSALRTLAQHRAQLGLLTAAGAGRSEAEAALAAAEEVAPPVTVAVTDPEETADAFAGISGFDLGASSQLLLFVFLSSLTGASTFIDARRNRTISRILAAPVSARQLASGQVLGRWTIAMVQGILIIIAARLIFGVDWGNPLLTVLVLAVFGLTAAGAALVMGALISSEGAATGAGIGIGLVLAALGGCMLPLDLFTGTLRTVAHVTPHAWAYEAFAAIQRHDAGLLDVLPQVGVLAGFAVIAVTIGTLAVRRSLSRPL
ncbi:ABC transporter permease subunit [Pseudactinotalea sp. HY160]|uniref:ABC transporter permease n=1 Tax=Pseudactinotalea sp. HY160 TaxID=2654490 RepID=UPI00128CB1E6|nr:ABC transporter permease [Pseudactinotalea sp. HY160]MPV50168.1 ABC transporter permease subunit [Pseudactinotalea sp. HY160]